MSEHEKIQVGAFLASHNKLTGWKTHKVEKITPSGRIHCGNFILNADLSIRGSGGYTSTSFHRITAGVRAKLKRQKNLMIIDKTVFHNLPSPILAAIAELIEGTKDEEKTEL